MENVCEKPISAAYSTKSFKHYVADSRYNFTEKYLSFISNVLQRCAAALHDPRERFISNNVRRNSMNGIKLVVSDVFS